MTANLRTLATSIALALSLTACGGLMEGDDFEDRALPACPTAAREWAQNTVYKVGDEVQFQGRGFFSANQAHTSFDAGWTPVAVPALWKPLSCANNPAGGGVVVTPPPPPAPPPPAQNPPPNNGGNNNGGANQPPPVNAACQANGRPGPLFDVAGDKNIGNGAARQFIGGRCLSNADCASNCCARPCGICSGPGAQFQAGKQGCGFPN